MIRLVGCGSKVPSARAGVDAAVNRAAFQGSGLNPGIELGWHDRLYQLVDAVNANQVGRKLGEVVYHGSLGMSFTLFRF
jgi:hypothetical protein